MFMNDSVIVEFMGFPNPAHLIFLPILLHPMSRGSSHTVSADATAVPSFDLMLLQSPFDLYILTKATQHARTFATQSSLMPFLAAAGEISPAFGPHALEAPGIQPGSHPSSIIYGIGEKAAAMLKASPLSDDV
ncbi:hypothetical protein B0H14DRAFT_3499021 [Mycena olivaceomarginata]|nr:hypothetical protein B0H14DRAFT_3499021 [Mycena olivaceomarginata]